MSTRPAPREITKLLTAEKHSKAHFRTALIEFLDTNLHPGCIGRGYFVLEDEDPEQCCQKKAAGKLAEQIATMRKQGCEAWAAERLEEAHPPSGASPQEQSE